MRISILLSLVCACAMSLETSAAEYQQLRLFNDPTWGPISKPLVLGSKIYGTYNQDLFRVNLDGTGYEAVHTFGTPNPGGQNGYDPFGSLAYDGQRIFGTTNSGGLGGSGVVYAVDPTNGDFQKLADINPLNSNSLLPGGVVLAGSTLYGSTGAALGSDTIYRVNTDGSGYEELRDSFQEVGARLSQLLVDGTTIYGTLYQYGPGTIHGTVIAMETDGSNLRVLHAFNGGAGDGSNPWVGALSLRDGVLYGATTGGGANDRGTIYKLNPDGTGFEVLHEFDGTDGQRATSVTFLGDKLIGFSDLGGPLGGGTVFMLNTDGTGFETLHAFAATEENISLGLTVVGETAYGYRFVLGGATGELFSITVPEPSSVILAGLGILTLGVVRGRRSWSRHAACPARAGD